MRIIDRRLPRGRWTAGLTAAVVMALAVTVAGAAGWEHAGPIGMTLSAAFGFAAATVIGWRSLRKGAGERFRLVLALACVIWASGEIITAVAVNTDGRVYPSTGHLVSVLALPFLVAGLVLLPRGVTEYLGSLRLLCEGLMIGSSLHLVLWLYLGPSESSASADLFAGVLGLHTLMIGLLVVVAVRDSEPLVTVAALLIAGFVLADVLAAASVVQLPGWLPAAVSCVTWPIVVLALTAATPHRKRVPGHHSPRGELRRTIVTAAGVFLPAAATLWAVSDTGATPLPTVGAAVGIICGFGGREVVRALQSRRLMNRLARQANEDPLTRLGNRRALTAHLAEEQHRTTPTAVLTLDIDRFKEVNSELGNAVGDALLVTVSRAVRQECEHADAVAYRLGGDEFAVLAHGDREQVTTLADALRRVVRAGAGTVPGCAHLHLTGSVGVAHVAPEGGHEDPLLALTRSAEALRVAKETRDTVCVYDGELAESLRQRATMERRLRDAVADGAIELHYQPVIDLHTGQVRGLEALSRWTDEELGQVRPDVFIALAEQSGLVVELGRQALERAIALAVDIDARTHGIDVAVNVSPVQLRSQGYVEEVVRLLHRHGAEPERLVIEVTEGIFMDPDDPAVQALHRLSEIGVTIAIDDFGSGYSSFGYMTRLPADVIKVDRSLITGLHDPYAQAVLRAIIDMASALGLDVIVEGVETPEVADVLRSMGASLCQGWLYSAAVPPDQVLDLLARFGTAGADAGVTRASAR